MISTFDRLATALADRYVIERELGSGGMATVYLAHDLKHGRNVAIKVLRPELAAALGTERFVREIEIAANLTHPHILPLFDSGEAEAFLYYVMPYVQGESLRERLTRDRKLSVPETVSMTSQIASALTYAHERGVIHRDIKPENILLTGDQAIVADFGIARAVEAAGGEKLTGTGLAIGTPAYMSPEQAMGSQQLDATTDVYALGCVVYEMLVGRTPFEGATPQALLAKHAVDTVPSMCASYPMITVPVERTVERALSKAPAARFATAAEFAKALAGATTAEAQMAEARRVARRRWAHGLVAAGAAAMLALGGWWVTGRVAGQPIERLAILPASNMTRDSAQAYFVDGVHEALVTELQRAGLPIIARQSVLHYRDTGTPIPQIVRELGLDGLIQPEVGREGDSVIVNLALYLGPSDVPAWTGSFPAEVQGVMGLYRDVSRRVADQLGMVLSARAEQRLGAEPVVDPQVYELVLRGKHHLRQFTPADVDLAEQHFERALALDSTYASAYLELARVWSSRSQMNLLPTDSTNSVVRRLYDRARELDPELFEADKSNADFLVWREWEWDAGYAAYRRALQADPNDASTHIFFALALVFGGRWEEADEHRRRAVELDPLDPLLLGMAAMQLVNMGRFQEAIEALGAHPALNPATGLAHAPWRTALHQLGRHEEAFAVTRAYHEGRGDGATVTALDEGLREGGAHVGFRRAAEVLASRWRGTYTIHIADLYALAGEWESALEWIEAAVEVRDANLPVIGSLPTFWPLHDDPRFRAIVERMGLPLLPGPSG